MNTIFILLAIAFLVFIAYHGMRYIDAGREAAEEYNTGGVVWSIFWIIIAALAAHNVLDLIVVLANK